MISSLYVWNFLPGATQPVVAGRLDIESTPAGAIGTFVYGRSYLARKESISLDPVTLPLMPGSKRFTTLGGFPGVVLDACPDRWGIKVIDRIEGKKAYPAGYLLMNDPGRAGSLAFSTNSAEPPAELASREFSLPELLDAAAAVEADRPVDPELLKAMHPGTGGARPKCNIVADNAIWIAKFPSLDDAPWVSIPRLEHATMQLAEACGVRAAPTRVETVGGRDVCFVKRFDRAITAEGEVVRNGCVSARTIFFADPGYAAVGTGSYGRLARWMTRYGCVANEQQQLFRRMVFNVAVRNSDDHELNHGLVQRNGRFCLAEAYDVLPMLSANRIHQHALLIGDSAAGTVENLIGNAAAFGISGDDAKAIVSDVQQAIRSQWQDIFYAAGLGDEEINRLGRYFAPIVLSS